MTTTPDPTPEEETWHTLDGGILQVEPAPELVPDTLRSGVYWSALTVAALAFLIAGQADVWAPQYADRIAESWDQLDNWFLFITGALGVAYRPTRRR
jgi:hypothetical protein